MSPEHEQLVRASWRSFEPIAEQWAPFFYDRLFELHPASRALFKNTDMDALGPKVMQMFGAIVDALDRSAKLVEQSADLWRRHVTYGVRERDYDSVGTALIWTLEEALGAAFTPDVRSAWVEAYALLVGIMRRAARRSTGGGPDGASGESPDRATAR